MSEPNKFCLPLRHLPQEKNVWWLEFEDFLKTFSPINLSQNYPICSLPIEITESLSEIAKGPNHILHQYTRDYGHPRLVSVLSKIYSPLIEREIDSNLEILVTVGAYEALFACIVGHVDIGDEVIIIEPFFDCYVPLVKFAEGVAKFIPLRKIASSGTSSDWILDKTELESCFTPKTKILILNNPHNPSGKVFSIEELQEIAELCKKYNVLVLADEVYEWSVFEPKKHIRIASLPGMWERTITVGSAGKSLNITGWRIGWAYGPANLLHNLKIVHQNSVYTGNTPMQEVVAVAFENELQRLNHESKKVLERKKQYMVQFLKEAHFEPVVPEAGYFLMADWSYYESRVDFNSQSHQRKDFRFAKWMIKELGVMGIPMSAFYNGENKSLGEKFLRFCFSNSDDTLRKAAEIFKKNNLN